MRLLTAGESHGPLVLAVIDGVPAGLAINAAGIDIDLRRRQLGYGRGARQRIDHRGADRPRDRQPGRRELGARDECVAGRGAA